MEMLNGENVDMRFFKLLRNRQGRCMDIRVFGVLMNMMLKNLMICRGNFLSPFSFFSPLSFSFPPLFFTSSSPLL